MSVSKWSPMWTLVQFSVPQDTPAAKSAARKFIRSLKLKCSCCNLVVRRGRGMALVMRDRDRLESMLLPILPPSAEMRLIGVTDAQFGGAHLFCGKLRKMDGSVLA